MVKEQLCWICRKRPATTGEHKFPHAYLKRITDNWRFLVHGRWDGTTFRTQGPNSKNLKLKVLCAECNNRGTQLQDKALNNFLLEIDYRSHEIWDTRRIDLSCYDLLNLYRSLLKLEFSRLYANGVEVLPEISNFVSGGDDWKSVNKHVRMEFRITYNAKALGLMYPFESDSPYYQDPYFISHQINFGWLGVHFVYAPGMRPDIDWPSWSFDEAELAPGDLESHMPRL